MPQNLPYAVHKIVKYTMPHFSVIVFVCLIDQCHRLPRQKFTAVENLISSNSGPHSIAIEHSIWFFLLTTLTGELLAKALLST